MVVLAANGLPERHYVTVGKRNRGLRFQHFGNSFAWLKNVRAVMRVQINEIDLAAIRKRYLCMFPTNHRASKHRFAGLGWLISPVGGRSWPTTDIHNACDRLAEYHTVRRLFTRLLNM
jgi:hypothetical protein